MTSVGDVTARLPSNGGANPSTNTDEKWFCTPCVRRYGGGRGAKRCMPGPFQLNYPYFQWNSSARARSPSLSFLTWFRGVFSLALRAAQFTESRLCLPNPLLALRFALSPSVARKLPGSGGDVIAGRGMVMVLFRERSIENVRPRTELSRFPDCWTKAEIIFELDEISIIRELSRKGKFRKISRLEKRNSLRLLCWIQSWETLL